MPGYPALLEVLAGEVSREVAAVREEAERERTRLLEAARRAAADATAARLARARDEAEATLRGAREAVAIERERTTFLARRAELDALRDQVAEHVAAAADPELLARLLPEVLADAGEGPFTLVVDPGDEARCRALLAGRPALLARATIEAAPARRGGVVLVAGRLVVDDTLAARLARAWRALEPAIAARLFAVPEGAGRPEERAWPASTA